MKWGKSLVFREHINDIEIRVKEMLVKIFNHYGPVQFTITSIDATGKIGNELTHKGNIDREFSLDIADLIALFGEDGQVFELDAHTDQIGYFALSIADGMYVDCLGTNENAVIIEFLGEHIDLDPDSF